MSVAEILRLFSLLLLAYPNAEMFKGDIKKLKPTALLWSNCLQDIDFWLGKKAAMKLICESKYPPTIAAFREKAEEIRRENDACIRFQWNYFRQLTDLYGMAEALDTFAPDAEIRKALAMTGATETALPAYSEFKSAYESVQRSEAESAELNPQNQQRRLER